MIREIGFANRVQTGDRGHEIIIDPQAAHRVVHGRIDAHRGGVRVLIRDALVHFEEIAISLGDPIGAEPLDGVGEIEVHAASARPDAASFVAHFLRRARRDVPWRQIPEARVLPLEVVIPLAFRYLVRHALISAPLRHPHAAVVA